MKNTSTVEVRVLPWQKALMQREAYRVGLDLSSWMRSICLLRCSKLQQLPPPSTALLKSEPEKAPETEVSAPDSLLARLEELYTTGQGHCAEAYELREVLGLPTP